MLFSIITITFNAEKYLSETLTSVAEQECSDLEHILWDGGSSDKTLEIAASFPHVKVHKGHDEGISDAMNKAAALAKGEFLLFLHSDDYLSNPQVLSAVSTSIHQHPEMLWLYGQARIIDGAGKTVRQTPFTLFNHKKLKKYNTITHPSTFVSRRLFAQMGGFRKSLRYAMDYDLWLRLAEITTPLPLPLMISSFREHDNSLSTSEPHAVADEAYRVRHSYQRSFWARWKPYRTWKRRKAKIS